MLALCRSPSPRVCVNMCTVCNNISSYHRFSLTPSIHSLWPVWGLSKQPPGSVYAGTEDSPVTLGTLGACVSSLAVYADILVTTQHTRVYFLPVCVCVTPGLLCPTKRFLWPDKKLSRGQGPMVITWTRGEERGASQGLQTRIANARSISRQFFRFIRMCFDNPCHASWQRQQQ